MPTKTARAVVSVLIVGGALSLLLFTTMRGSAEYYKHVDEVMADAPAWYGKSVQLHGFVVDGSVMRRPNTLEYRFQVQNNDAVVTANYTGVVPDTFKGGTEVVLTGTLTPQGFHVDEGGIMAKCPSKYDPNKIPVR
ncbi:MAG TPA: cytochrome c maturation protein CcmE [Vicinamibacterales bacterium]|jgi:cytochrome c-type biogenesis protein CcmE|nr:cytochrome c maturation protein CcmE [Vicinamibacterales bacterium]